MNDRRTIDNDMCIIKTEGHAKTLCYIQWGTQYLSHAKHYLVFNFTRITKDKKKLLMRNNYLKVIYCF